MKKKKVNNLESFANAATREGITYGQKQSREYAQSVKIGPIPSGYRKGVMINERRFD